MVTPHPRLAANILAAMRVIRMTQTGQKFEENSASVTRCLGSGPEGLDLKGLSVFGGGLN